MLDPICPNAEVVLQRNDVATKDIGYKMPMNVLVVDNVTVVSRSVRMTKGGVCRKMEL